MAYNDPFTARAKTGEQENEKDHKSNAGVIQKRGRESGYVPYQDSPYYNDHNSSSNSPDYGSRDRRKYDPGYREVHETVRLRRFKSDAGHTSRPRDDEDSEEQGQYPRRSSYYPGLEYASNRLRRRGDSSNSSDSQTRHRPRSRSRSQERYCDDSRSRSSRRSRSRSSRPRQPQYLPQEDPRKPAESYSILKALKSAAMAGGVEAVRCRSEPGPWSGQKGKRIAIAAATGTAIGALRNGRLASSGKMPYADAAMTAFYAIDFLKRVARHTEHGKNSLKEQRDWYDDRDWDEEARGRWGGSTKDRMRSKGRQ